MKPSCPTYLKRRFPRCRLDLLTTTTLATAQVCQRWRAVEHTLFKGTYFPTREGMFAADYVKFGQAQTLTNALIIPSPIPPLSNGSSPNIFPTLLHAPFFLYPDQSATLHCSSAKTKEGRHRTKYRGCQCVPLGH
jgi:hypothetical protein